ncbi:MAG: hypothetical protein COS42_09635 [Flavobacteriales bacterium CG03_land_8_20_14_0_80_35_15]|nr:MAG: hypothetical protein COS42_09635 [Flavobacteriales bacterium CG03_land_8_20_14_0_80_35_15]
MVKILYILCFCSFFASLSAQTITIQGKVTDTIGLPLSFANVIADPKEDIDIKFALTDENGIYKLTLEKDKTYYLTASYLGFLSQSVEISAKENIIKNFKLLEYSEQLNEIMLNYTPPVVIKKDTITYKVEAFINGNERKLRDILKKLPAVEVDRAGNVKVQGKKITKVLVDNKEFFTGDSKLAVNNIPADAVYKIEVLDNYNEVSYLKGLEESDQLAMNVKLKDSKKKFVFGDVEVGGGFKQRYLLHPSLYYYSPKTSIISIGDFNNIGTKSFTIKDYLEFEGGFNKLFGDAKSYFSILNDDFAHFLVSQNFTASRHKFGALNLNQTINSKTELSSYGIWSDLKNETKSQTLNNYFAIDNLIENRTNRGEQKSQFGIGKLKFNIKPNHETDIIFGSYLKASSNHSNENIFTITPINSNTITTKINANNISFKQNIQWNKQFNKKHVISFAANYHFQKVSPTTNWLTDKEILKGLIPVVDENQYNIFKVEESRSNSAEAILKHYWVLNRHNHLYTTVGFQLNDDNLVSSDFQILENLSINNFLTSDFGNNTHLNFSDTYLGIHYKAMSGKITVKPGLFYHIYHWNINQFDEQNVNDKTLFLPELNTDIAFNRTQKLLIKYNYKALFPNISEFANRFTLLNFNSIYKGNAHLKNERYHQLQLNLYSFNLSKKLFYNFTANFRKKELNIKNSTILNGIDEVSSPILSDFEDRFLSLSSSIDKGIEKYKFSLTGSISIGDYEKPINNELIYISSDNYSFGGGIETKWKKFPNLELNYTKSFSNYRSKVQSQFDNDIFTVFLNYDFFKDFILKLDYSYESYTNKSFNTTSVFNNANGSLIYKKETSPFGFEITANNLFNIGFKQRNSFSSILVSDDKTFILPHFWLFTLTYKL